jgi:hypothetical protein
LPEARCGDGEAVAQVWYRDHHIIAEKRACNYQITKSGHRRALPCRFCSWAHGSRRTRSGDAVEHDDSAPTLVRRMVRKRQSSSCSFDQRLAVASRPRRLATVCRKKKNQTRRRHLVKDGKRVKHSDRGAGWAIYGRQQQTSARASRRSGVVFRAPLVALCRTHAMMGGGGLQAFKCRLNRLNCG